MKNFLLIITLLTGFNLAFSQADGLKEIYDDAEYFFYSESYNDALINYLKIYRRGYQTNANINFKIGFCYLRTADKSKGIPYLEEAAKNTSIKYKEGTLKEDKAPIEAILYLANAYRVTYNLEKAIVTYDDYLKQSVGESEAISYARKQLEACKTAIELQKSPVNYKVQVLDKIINNSNPNFSPAVSSDETVMAYVSRLRFYDAIFVSRKIKDLWSAPVNITPQIQSDGNQYCCAFSANGNTLYLTKEDNYNSDIYITNYDGKTWSKSIPLNKNINSKFWESHASVSSDDKFLYFASNRKGMGGMDIFVSERGANGDWGVPTNIGSSINTNLDEDYPFVSNDGKVLFFASQGHKTMGGFDIFYSIKNGDSWSEPKNIGYPINTTDDDIFFCPVNNGTIAYQAIYPKENGLGDLDIVRYEINNKYALCPVKGSAANLFAGTSLKGIKLIDSKGAEQQINYNSTTKMFDFSVSAGVYQLIFESANQSITSNVFQVNRMTEGTALIIIPELIGLEGSNQLVIK